MEFAILGPLEARIDGVLVAISGDRERAVLALLLMHAGEVVSADRLIDEVWGEQAPDNPANALQAIISRLRKALGKDILVTRKPGYVVDLTPDQLDSSRFERLVERARGERDEPLTASRLLDEALALWRGTPLADLSFEDFAQQEIARLDEIRAAALEEKVEVDLALGRHTEVIASLERLTAEYPLRERLRAQLMVALYRSQRQGEAIEVYHEARRVLSEELGVDPGPELEKTYQQILRQDPSLQPLIEPASGAPRTNIPTRITSFVGRQAEVDHVAKLVKNNRLVTVIGPGGSGKTSLAIEVARGLTDSFDRGVWLVELAPVSDPALVVSVISDAVGLSEDRSGVANTQPTIARLTTFLRNKELLLIMDNCEHVIQAAAEAAELLLTTCPNLSILATSREVLASSGEFVWTIPPLSVPHENVDLATLDSYDAVRLLLQRIASAGAEPELDEEGTAAAAQISRRLDGMPLAIELAAARARSLPLPEIARRLDRRFRLLAGGARTTPPRHRTLRAAIDWSHDLLSASERALFRRLSVFSGGWTLEAAEQVCADAKVEDVVDLQSRLVDQSLIVARGNRFTMLETILAYAREHLVAAGEEPLLRERHARFFKTLAESIEPELQGVNQAHALKRLRDEEHNLRLALQWGREKAGAHPDIGLGLAAALGWYWYVGRQVEGRFELRSMLDVAPGASDTARARALQALSLSLRPAGCIVHASPEAAEVARASVALFRELRDERGAAMSQLLVAVEGVAGGDVDGFLTMIDEARVRLREHGDAWGLALADFIEMEIRLYHDSPDRALALGEQAARQFDALDDNWGRSAVRLHLGWGLRLAGRVDEARVILEEAAAISRETGLPNNLAGALVGLGDLAVHVGNAAEADRRFTECQDIVDDLADETMQAHVASGRGDVARYLYEPSAALERYERALTLYRQSGVPRGIARALTGHGAAEIDLARLDRAAKTLDQALTIAEQARDPLLHAMALEQLSRLSAQEGRESDARKLLEQAGEIRLEGRRPRGALASRDVDEIDRAGSGRPRRFKDATPPA